MGITGEGVSDMLEPDRPSGGQRPAVAACDHDYVLDKDMQMWICEKCGTSLDLMTQLIRHECGADCDRHGDISAIG
jgi:hypothetical protein